MATTLDACTLQIHLATKLSSNPTLDTAVNRQEVLANLRQAFANGTGNEQANMFYAGRRSIGASSSENIDLAGGLTDAFGNAITFTKVKAIVAVMASDNGGNITFGNASSNGFTGPFGGATHTLAFAAQGIMVPVAPNAGWTVTAGTGDILKVANSDSGAAGEYDLYIVGTV